MKRAMILTICLLLAWSLCAALAVEADGRVLHVAKVSDGDAATAIRPVASQVQPVVPKVQPVVPKVQPVVPKIQPVVPKIQPVVPKVQPVVPKIQPVVPKIQPVVPGVGAAQAADEEPAEEMPVEAAAEAEPLALAGEEFEVDGVRLKAAMFTRDAAFIEQEFSPMPANGMVHLLRLDCVDSKLKSEQIESLGAHFRIEYPESGTQMSVVGCEADTTDADDLHDRFDLVFYSKEWLDPEEAPVDEIKLFCDDTAYSLVGIPDQGAPLETTPILQLKLSDYRERYSAGRLEKADGGPVFAGKLLIALSFTESGANPVDIEDGYRGIPAEWLAKDFDEADTLIFIRSIKRQVGTYTGVGGGPANETTTQIEAIDLHSGRTYEPYVVAVNQPPQTIMVRTVNGVPMSNGGSGKFEEEQAAQYILENHVEYTPQPTPEPVPDPTEGPIREAVEGDLVDEVLDALGDPVYRTTYDALLSGEIIRNGSKGDAAKGMQQTLVAFGQDIAVDGSVGPKTIAALNAVQAAFGLSASDSLDAVGYAELLPGLLITVDPDAADALLPGRMEADEYDYLRACALFARGRFASAKALFEESGRGDWETRAEACAQPWPKTGQLYKNSAVKGSSTQLTVKFNSDGDVAMLVKIYTTDGTLARTMFIRGNEQATTSLPAGTYIVKDGTGKNWYGEEETFGSEGSYEIMTFDDDQQEVQLLKNYASTITINVKEADPTADSVGSEWESWSDF